MKSPALVALCVLTFGCDAVEPVDDADDISSTSEDIIGGTTDNGDPSVVALFVHAPGATSGSLCTGTVVSSRAVLTAAHCVDPRVVGSGQVFEVLTGTTLTGPTLAVSATAFDPAFDVNNLGGGHDVGVVTLAQATSLAALPFNHTAYSNQLASQSIRIVGYGTDTHANTGAGTKRTATTRVDAFNNLLIQIGNTNRQTCHGDSGGPAFQTVNGVETVVGVTSFGQDRSSNSVCFGGGFDTRIDAVAAFVDSHL